MRHVCIFCADNYADVGERWNAVQHGPLHSCIDCDEERPALVIMKPQLDCGYCHAGVYVPSGYADIQCHQCWQTLPDVCPWCHVAYNLPAGYVHDCRHYSDSGIPYRVTRGERVRRKILARRDTIYCRDYCKRSANVARIRGTTWQTIAAFLRAAENCRQSADAGMHPELFEAMARRLDANAVECGRFIPHSPARLRRFVQSFSV